MKFRLYSARGTRLGSNLSDLEGEGTAGVGADRITRAVYGQRSGEGTHEIGDRGAWVSAYS